MGDEATRTAVRQAVALNFDRMGDPWRAEQLMSEALPLAESLPVLYPLLSSLQLLTEATINEFHLMPPHTPAGMLPSTPRAPQAAATSDPTLARAQAYARRARAAAQCIGDEHFRGFLDGLLGEVLLQGQVDEAWPMLERALCQAQAHGHASLAARMDCTLAEGLLRRQEPQQAINRLQVLLADGGEHLPPTLQQRAHRAMARACQAVSQTERATMHGAQDERLQRALAGWRGAASAAPTNRESRPPSTAATPANSSTPLPSTMLPP